jgi:hypothetical protein
LRRASALAEVGVVAGIGRRPGAAILGVVDRQRFLLVGKRHRVAGLQIFGRVRDRHQRIGVEAAVLGCAEPGRVVVRDRLVLRRIDGGIAQLGEGGVERRQCAAHHLALGVDDERIAEVLETHFEYPRLGFPDSGQPVEHRLPQRGAAGLKTDAAGDGGGQHTHGEQHQHELGLDADPIQQAALGPTAPQPLGEDRPGFLWGRVLAGFE